MAAIFLNRLCKILRPCTTGRFANIINVVRLGDRGGLLWHKQAGQYTAMIG